MKYQIIDVAECLDDTDYVFVTGADVFKPAHDCPNCKARLLDESGLFCEEDCEREYYDNFQADDEVDDEF